MKIEKIPFFDLPNAYTQFAESADMEESCVQENCHEDIYDLDLQVVVTPRLPLEGTQNTHVWTRCVCITFTCASVCVTECGTRCNC